MAKKSLQLQQFRFCAKCLTKLCIHISDYVSHTKLDAPADSSLKLPYKSHHFFNLSFRLSLEGTRNNMNAIVLSKSINTIKMTLCYMNEVAIKNMHSIWQLKILLTYL